MDYSTALNRLLSLVDYERLQRPSDPRIKFDLGRMKALIQSLGNPHLDTPTVHIAGTKGKGSTAAMVASVLSDQGYTTGMFSSPHLHTFRERISINGSLVSEEEFGALVAEVWPHLEGVNLDKDDDHVTFFEALTAMAFLLFRWRKADFQVLEVGMGGRLDSTNLVLPQVCAITPVSLDHTVILGDRVELVAQEKAGIIKPGVVVVSAPQPLEAKTVIRRVCQEKEARLVEVGGDIRWRKGTSSLEGQSFLVQGRLDDYQLWMPLLGDYQVENAATAVGVLEVLREQGWELSTQAMIDGFKRVSWPCRMEVLQRKPLVVVDGAHNPASMRRLCQSLPDYFRYQRVVLIIGTSMDKDIPGIVEELRVLEPLVIATCSRHPRAIPTFDLAQAFELRGVDAYQVTDVREAVVQALQQADRDDLVLATGSLFLAAEVREVLLDLESEIYPELLPNHQLLR